jgi:hypothetical protein
MFNHHGFRDAVALSGVNSINWARIVAQVVYYFTSAVALGAPARTVASRRRAGILRGRTVDRSVSLPRRAL